MTNEISADTLIEQGVTDYKAAATRTAQGIIDMGKAVLKVKRGCEAKQGGTDFPEVAMTRLGLAESTARSLAIIGENAEKLVTAVTSLPADSMTTLYEIARMSEEEIADKITRGVIHPGASRGDVLEKKRHEVSVQASGNPATQQGFEGVLKKLSPTDKATLLAEYRNAMQEAVKQAVKTAKAEAAQARERAVDTMAEAAKQKEAMVRAQRLLQYPLTKEEYKLILGLLHPDRHPGMEDRAQRAFHAFKPLEIICKKRDLKAVK